MAMYLCKIHSRTPCAFVCPHLKDKVVTNRFNENFSEINVNYICRETDQLEFVMGYSICLDCSTKYKIPRVINLPADNLDYLPPEFSEVLESTLPICAKCFENYKMNNGEREHYQF